MEQPITQTQCERNKQACYENNIMPIMEELKSLHEKLDTVIPAVNEYNDWKKAFRVGSIVLEFVIKIIIYSGIIIGAIYGIKEWINKGVVR